MFTFELNPYLDLAFETILKGSVIFVNLDIDINALLPINFTDAGMANFCIKLHHWNSPWPISFNFS